VIFYSTISTILLFNDLDDPSAAWLNQNCAAIYDRVAVFPNAIFLRYVVIRDAFFRQDGANPQILPILIGWAPLLDDIAAKTWTLVDAQDAVDAAHDTTNHTADDRSHRTSRPFTLPGASFYTSRHALRVSDNRQRYACGNDSNSDETADHVFSERYECDIATSRETGLGSQLSATRPMAAVDACRKRRLMWRSFGRRAGVDVHSDTVARNGLQEELNRTGCSHLKRTSDRQRCQQWTLAGVRSSAHSAADASIDFKVRRARSGIMKRQHRSHGKRNRQRLAAR
jgi:hypothetical protein